VNAFYKEKYDSIYRKSRARNRGRWLWQPDRECLNPNWDNLEEVDLRQLDIVQLKHLYAALFELREELHWYGHVNRTAVEKVLRKLDQHYNSHLASRNNEASVLSDAQFATQSRCLGDLERLKEVLATILVALKAQSHEETSIHTVEEPVSTSKGATGLLTPPCSDSMIALVASSDVSSVNEYIQNMVVELGRRKHLPIFDNSSLDRSQDSLRSLATLVERLSINKRDALQLKDSFGRKIIHYAAEKGLDEACRILLKSMKEWGELFDPANSVSLLSPLFEDSELSTPLHLSVLGGHVETTKIMLDGLEVSEDIEGPLGRLLLLALK
jgi:hypothetical protein